MTYTATQDSDAKAFSETVAGQERAVIRRIINNPRNGLNAEWQRVASHVANLWFANRKEKGFFNPPLEAVAHKFRISRRTVQRVFAWMREHCGLVAIGYEKGGRKPTRYILDLVSLIDKLAPSKVKQVAGELVELKPSTPSDTHVSGRENPDKLSDVYKTLNKPVRGWQLHLGVAALADGLARIVRAPLSRSRRVTPTRSALWNVPPPAPNFCVWPIEVPF